MWKKYIFARAFGFTHKKNWGSQHFSKIISLEPQQKHFSENKEDKYVICQLGGLYSEKL